MPPSTPPLTSRKFAQSANPHSMRSSTATEREAAAAINYTTPQVTLESEGDPESETDLPTMTPPKQLPLRSRNASSSQVLNGFNHNASNNTSGGNYTTFQMQRAHSSPGVDSSGRMITPSNPYRPTSPLSSGRRRSPLRSSFEESYPSSSWNSVSIEPNIPEHAELEISSPVTPENEMGTYSGVHTYTGLSNTLPRSRRRPASPLHQSASAPSLHASARAASLNISSGNSPSFSATRYANEPYPTYGYSFSSTSSMPSTPTSLRSRSPSISSLDTIEDTPDAEEAAMMEEDYNKVRVDESDNSTESRRKGAAGLRSNKDRKRWSVCGAERRADFSLEPIEE